ncbi:MAG: AAA family ATPase [Desulfurella sp.]|uniref:bifunctional aminoglycoside phosphotransferase/ATP-binding protein n=1 Tax=Desulfurella sp. TaxID=1962857 RepID=UPI003D14F50F
MNQLIENLKNKLKATLIETHISYVLVNEIVYKIKKSVNFGFLDFTSLQKRKYYCEKEVELNSRFSPDLYLGVVSITKNADEFFISGPGEVVEYAVAMKKLPQDKMMDVLLEKDKVTLEDIDKLASIIANFHKNAQTNTQISEFGKKENIKINTDENFNQTIKAQGTFLTKHQFESIKKYTNDFLDTYDWQKRIVEQKIKDCHGDLYSHNICLADKIYIYDCIEFNDRFRYSDVASDVAFLLMDLEFQNKQNLSDFFLQRYIEYSNDYSIKEVLNFYKTYRAYVRGKIYYFENKKELSSKYFDLSYKYIDKKYKPILIAMVGLTGCGKSYFSERLSQKLNAKVFSSDIVRKQLFSGNTNGFEKGIYSTYHTQVVYEKLSQLAYEALKDGFNVILDATYIKHSHRQSLVNTIEKLGITPHFVFLDPEEPIIFKNLEKRQQEKSISDGTVDIYFKQKEIFEKPENAIIIHSNEENSLNYVLKTILEAKK